MNCRERIMTALSKGQPDRVPVFELAIDEASVVKLAKLLIPEPVGVKAKETRFGEESFQILDLYCSIIEELEIDSTTTNFSLGLEDIGEGYGRDKYGTVYQFSAHGEAYAVEGPIKESSDLQKFDMLSRLQTDDFAGAKYVIDKVGKSKAHFMNIWDPFKLSWRLTGGMEALLMHYMLHPQLVHDLARITTDFGLAAIDMAAKIGVDVITVPGDLAGEESLLISPKCFQDYIKPYHKEIVDYAHKRDMKIVKHSDGNIWPILDDFVEVGFDGIHPIQPQCMDIGEVKRHLAGKACVLGNIDCRNLLPFGSQEEVEQAVKETIEKVAEGGGYIISSSNSIHPNCNPGNYIAMVRAAHKYGVYQD